MAPDGSEVCVLPVSGHPITAARIEGTLLQAWLSFPLGRKKVVEKFSAKSGLISIQVVNNEDTKHGVTLCPLDQSCAVTGSQYRE